MAEHEDPRVSAGYRRLGAETPPEALDAAILAASKRAVGAGPRRAGRPLRRWALPVSIAAVVVLTMSLVVRIQLERPDLETATPVPVTPQVLEGKTRQRADKKETERLEKRAVESAAQAKPKVSAPAPAPAAPASAERDQAAREASSPPVAQKPAAAGRFVPEPPASGAPAPAESTAPANLGAASALAPAAVEDRAQRLAAPAGKAEESPRAWLERIVRLRREGHVKQADESLAEFRKRYPDYRIPEELREAVLGTAKAE
jgi:outer membrane biosynthesis protein TonB